MLPKLKPLFAVKTLKEKQFNIFTPLEFRRLFGVSQNAAHWFIKTYTKKKVFNKLRNGLYCLSDAPANNYLIANKLYQPSYVSFDTALSYYNLIPETIYSITSATSQISREFTTQGILYTYHKIKISAYTGYLPTKYQDQVVFIAEPEKALADYLYFVERKLRQFHYERLDLKKINHKKLFSFLKLFERPSLLNLTQKIYDELKQPARVS